MKNQLIDDELLPDEERNAERYADLPQALKDTTARQRASIRTDIRRTIEKRRERLALKQRLQEYGEPWPEDAELPF
ncbi:MAG: hypothetical protein WCC36_01155 [Gammaproteobacteria bacterium]